LEVLKVRRQVAMAGGGGGGGRGGAGSSLSLARSALREKGLVGAGTYCPPSHRHAVRTRTLVVELDGIL
jgi:hypothetical protein